MRTISHARNSCRLLAGSLAGWWYTHTHTGTRVHIQGDGGRRRAGLDLL